MDAIDIRLEAALRAAGPAIDNNGFSTAVMAALPPKRHANVGAGRWTLGAAAAGGAMLTWLVAAPLAPAFGALLPGKGFAASLLAALFIAVIAVPTAWAFQSE